MLRLAALCSEVLLAGTWLLALTASLATASTLPTTTVDTPGPQTYTVPGTGQYEITADGAQGGGGLGAEIQG